MKGLKVIEFGFRDFIVVDEHNREIKRFDKSLYKTYTDKIGREVTQTYSHQELLELSKLYILKMDNTRG